MKQEDKIVKLDNTRSITQENYEVLKKYKASMKHVADMIYYMRKRFDEAFTKYPNSNPNERNLKILKYMRSEMKLINMHIKLVKK